MEYIAHIEPVAACLRVFKNGKVFGEDEYEFSCTVVYHSNGKIVELKGIRSSGGIPFSAMRTAICRAFFLQGVDHLFWERRKSMGKKRIFVNTKTMKIERGIIL